MALAIRTEYWDDPKARRAFKEFMVTIHGLDLSEWEAGGFWDYAYTPFSFFDGGKIVSSLCVYSLEAIIKGRTTHLAQISSVGTLPAWRRKGLSRKLTNTGVEWARDSHEGVFLFADREAIPFYKACGFKPIDEYVEVVAASKVPKRKGAVKLNPGVPHDLARIYEYAKRRTPISAKFSIMNEKLIMFHCLHSLRDSVYEIPDLDCLAFLKRGQGRLRIYDIVGARVPFLKEFYPYVADPTDRTIEFHFHADNLGLEEVETKVLRGNNPFVTDPFPVQRPVFPFTARA